eukprot:1037376-Pleurochrysis_carterae.AAC.2
MRAFETRPRSTARRTTSRNIGHGTDCRPPIVHVPGSMIMSTPALIAVAKRVIALPGSSSAAPQSDTTSPKHEGLVAGMHGIKDGATHIGARLVFPRQLICMQVDAMPF